MARPGQPLLRAGDSGEPVLDVQARLTALGYPVTASERGNFGPQTESAVKAFQVRRGLSADGIVGPATWRELVEAGWRLGSRPLRVRIPVMRGDDVRDLQLRLNALGFDAGTEDGVYGHATEAAVREFQRNTGLPADGWVGRDTVEALNRLRMRVLPGSKAQLRERMSREGGLEGRKVFLDPGHGGEDAGVVTSPGIPESYVVYRVAEVAAGALVRMGALPILSRAIQHGPDTERRAREANSASADIAISFHLACRPEPAPSVAFYRGQWTQSDMGRELAESLASCLRPRLGSASVLGRNLPFLRDTGMPAVVLDLSCPGAEPLVGEDPYLASLGESVAEGVRSFYTLATKR